MNTMREFALKIVSNNNNKTCCTGELDHDLIDLMLCAGSDAEPAEQPTHIAHTCIQCYLLEQDGFQALSQRRRSDVF